MSPASLSYIGHLERGHTTDWPRLSYPLRSRFWTDVDDAGRTIMGPNDRMITRVLMSDPVPVFDKNWAHTDVCVWDVAAAHLALEDALRTRLEEVGGEAFLITGNGRAWTLEDMRDTVKVHPSSFLSS